MIYLTGNVLFPIQNGPDDYSSDEDEDEDDYGLPADGDEELYLSEDDESDELDDLEDPSRITELASEDEAEEAPPKLIKAEKTKGKNKRSAPDSSEIEDPAEAKPTVDSILEKSLKPATAGAEDGDTSKMTKTQIKKMKKKLKDNQGNAVDTTAEVKVNGEDKGVKAKEDTPDKKVTFAKNLVGPFTLAGTSPYANSIVLRCII